ncbi:MAG: hypothetical protein E6J75_07070 [Deltaproteobacteria bacterium]|nr:MAG: hypothetical protein E6J75_07070 [Deltaproteobacteria bacterium]
MSHSTDIGSPGGSPEFRDPADLAAESARIYDICAGCRRCYNLCPSFTHLLDAIDGHDGEIQALSAAEDRRTVDLCFGCKLCYPLCPYTPPHRWGVDFPLLMQRAKVVRADREGIPLRDRLLGNPELLGRLGSAFPRVANWANRNRLLRWGMEKTLGVDRRPHPRGSVDQAAWRSSTRPRSSSTLLASAWPRSACSGGTASR